MRKDNILGARGEGLRASFLPLAVDNCKLQPAELNKLLFTSCSHIYAPKPVGYKLTPTSYSFTSTKPGNKSSVVIIIMSSKPSS